MSPVHFDPSKAYSSSFPQLFFFAPHWRPPRLFSYSMLCTANRERAGFIHESEVFCCWTWISICFNLKYIFVQFHVFFFALFISIKIFSFAFLLLTLDTGRTLRRKADFVWPQLPSCGASKKGERELGRSGKVWFLVHFAEERGHAQILFFCQ